MTALWPAIPLSTLIFECLSKNNNALFDDELIRLLQDTYGNVSGRELNKTLMCLELQGIIHVSVVTKNKRRIELV